VTPQKSYDLLDSIKDGADIYGMLDAKFLREWSAKHPNYMRILSNAEMREMGISEADGTGQMPYFGVIMLKDGRRWLEREKARLEAVK
jgi:hypothetical protein